CTPQSRAGAARGRPRQSPCTTLPGPCVLIGNAARIGRRAASAPGGVVGQVGIGRLPLGVDLFALLPVAAADGAFLLDAQCGDPAAGTGERLAAGDHAGGHPQHHQQHDSKCNEPDHGLTPCVGNNASNAELPRETNPSPSRVTNSAAIPSASAKRMPCSGPSTISRVDSPSASMAEGVSTVTAASVWVIGAAWRGSRVCE